MFQLEAMLPLLILAFLGTPAVLTQSRYHGSETGKHFCIVAPEGEPVTGIWASLKNNILSSIRLKFGNNWSQEYGSSGRAEIEVKLNPDETVLGFSGSFYIFMHQIIITTSQPRELIIGPLTGRYVYTSYPENPNHVFRGICGYYVTGGLKGMRYLWGNVNGTCTE
ncbi:common salivary protein 1, isoform CRA_a [Rattus norvegicus]|uniref:Common salivary protein 1, isoform CRA_a n=3 Tax=Rattus norvegicus TaxID=10116 RepID=A6HCN7_RAT|nr:common salivary protein 1 precursor [Rattus norvegicus]XP_038941081.1 common salivary protein 1 isoform X1 [Rattus norvegicus]XP_038941082.1 common salivary protein 1 isoform X1 [Rattus norvegicus]XP_038941083.1 common salivary protein 1 isoform X1 [Rattus norvegicus]EDM03792.1 common salivary protein 1, isoform CRA_a [Rattus norvegicus]EDM03793.1 common salivary protein 1, isoform CRA_a [Rattus norvegicus]|eukprot:NP_598306.2 common salivary protein 1 precursor [Rattus norvegicus]